MKSKSIGKYLLMLGILISISVDCIGIVLELHNRRQITRAAHPGLLNRAHLLPGYSPAGSFVPDTRHEYPCHVIRFASPHCRFCKLDNTIWKELQRRAHSTGCEILFTAPELEDMPPTYDIGADVSVAYTTLDFARQVPLDITPTTLVCNRNWIVTWSKVGPLDIKDIHRIEFQ